MYPAPEGRTAVKLALTAVMSLAPIESVATLPARRRCVPLPARLSTSRKGLIGSNCVSPAVGAVSSGSGGGGGVKLSGPSWSTENDQVTLPPVELTVTVYVPSART